MRRRGHFLCVANRASSGDKNVPFVWPIDGYVSQAMRIFPQYGHINGASGDENVPPAWPMSRWCAMLWRTWCRATRVANAFAKRVSWTRPPPGRALLPLCAWHARSASTRRPRIRSARCVFSFIVGFITTAARSNSRPLV
jgi:hypothetical protein